MVCLHKINHARTYSLRIYRLLFFFSFILFCKWKQNRRALNSYSYTSRKGREISAKGVYYIFILNHGFEHICIFYVQSILLSVCVSIFKSMSNICIFYLIMWFDNTTSICLLISIIYDIDLHARYSNEVCTQT